MKKIVLIPLVIIIISFLIGIISYQFLPEKVATSWDFHGEAKGFMHKFLGLFIMPFTMFVIFGILIFIPRIDPLRKNIEKFKTLYHQFIFVVILFLFYIYCLTIAWNFNIKFNMNHMLIPILGLLIFYVGYVLNKIERNWFIGIRTPWTLSSDKVWKKTHMLGSKLFKLSGLIIILGLFFIEFLWAFVLIPLAISVIWLIIYSYIEYKKA